MLVSFRFNFTDFPPFEAYGVQGWWLDNLLKDGKFLHVPRALLERCNLTDLVSLGILPSIDVYGLQFVSLCSLACDCSSTDL